MDDSGCIDAGEEVSSTSSLASSSIINAGLNGRKKCFEIW